MFARSTSRKKNTIVLSIFDYLLIVLYQLSIDETRCIKAQQARPSKTENNRPLFYYYVELYANLSFTFQITQTTLLIHSTNLHVQPLLQNTIKAHDKKGNFSS